MARMTNLYRLQQVEEALQHSRDRLREIDQILAQDERVAQAETAFESAREEYIQTKSRLGESEQAVSSQRTKIKDTEESLYGGNVTNPKELQDLQRESESLTRYLTTLEDRLLEAMVEHEEAENAYEAAKRNLEQVRADVAANHEDLSEERAELERAVERLETEREAAVNGVKEEDLGKYETIKQRVGGFPIAVAQDGTCGVCGMAIPGSKAQRVRSGAELIRCESCGRLLYPG